jgi:hypothetical protein
MERQKGAGLRSFTTTGGATSLAVAMAFNIPSTITAKSGSLAFVVEGSVLSKHDYGRFGGFTGTVEDNSISLFEPATCRQFSF